MSIAIRQAYEVEATKNIWEERRAGDTVFFAPHDLSVEYDLNAIKQSTSANASILRQNINFVV